MSNNNDSVNQQYLDACKNGEYEIVKNIDLKYVVPLHIINHYGHNPFFCAIDGGHIDLFIYLLKKDKENLYVYMSDRNNCTLYLYSIIVKNRYDMFCYLDQNYNFDVNRICGNNFTNAYMESIYRERTTVMKYLENKYSNDINFNIKNKYGYNVLTHAVMSGSVDIFRHVVQFNTDIDVIDHRGNNLIMVAAENRKYKIMRYLEDNYDFDINYQNNSKLTVYHIVKRNKINMDNVSVSFKYENVIKLYKKYIKLETDMLEYLENKMYKHHLKKYDTKFKFVGVDPNRRCMVCSDDFDEKSIICKCRSNHVVHKDCYFEYLNQKKINLSSYFYCIYCKDHMVMASYKWKN
jgi:ankyrin repeat protein